RLAVFGGSIGAAVGGGSHWNAFSRGHPRGDGAAAFFGPRLRRRIGESGYSPDLIVYDHVPMHADSDRGRSAERMVTRHASGQARSGRSAALRVRLDGF